MDYKNLGTPYKSNNITLYNCGCMELLKQTPDNYYELSLVDPPYGIKRFKSGGSRINEYGESGLWNNTPPNIDYFNELFRVSKNQIIWGSNNFQLPTSEYFIVWDKQQPEDFSFAMCEIAYTNIKRTAKIVSIPCRNQNRIHPTQKPVKLYEWLLKNYAKENDKTLDTHLGSGSIAIACDKMGFDLTACEIDKDYYDGAVKRLNYHQDQYRMVL